MPDTPTRILLADDHPIVRTGLRHVMSTFTGVSVVGEADSGEEALYLCSKLLPDLVFMDVAMAGIGGIGATRAIRATYPATRVLGLSTEAQPGKVTQMLQAGASGFLLKTCSTEMIEKAIHRAMAGEIVLDPEVRPLLHPTGPGSEEIAFGTQQRKVLALLVKGFTNPEIAERLDMSLPTARYHVSAILLKLGASNRAEAAAMAVQQNLVGPDAY
jgi:two-component system, NarL family, response regulator LiaR